MNLYVATYQLHATLDVDEVTSTIAEICPGPRGGRKVRFYCWAMTRKAAMRYLLPTGLDETDQLFKGDRYHGGNAAVDRALRDGVLQMYGDSDAGALAVVPLTVQGAVVGAVVVLKLFDHKGAFVPEDRELLDLLAAPRRFRPARGTHVFGD